MYFTLGIYYSVNGYKGDNVQECKINFRNVISKERKTLILVLSKKKKKPSKIEYDFKKTKTISRVPGQTQELLR